MVFNNAKQAACSSPLGSLSSLISGRGFLGYGLIHHLGYGLPQFVSSQCVKLCHSCDLNFVCHIYMASIVCLLLGEARLEHLQ